MPEGDGQRAAAPESARSSPDGCALYAHGAGPPSSGSLCVRTQVIAPPLACERNLCPRRLSARRSKRHCAATASIGRMSRLQARRLLL